jgi:molybdopterin converting factor small subunit
MNVRVRYLAQLKQAAGTPAERVELPEPCTVADLAVLLAGRRPGLRGVLLDGDNKVQRTVLTFLGDEQVGPERALREDDELTLLTPIAGGGGG